MMTDQIGILDVFNYALTVIFGLPLIIVLSGGFRSQRDWIVFLSLCPALLTLQTCALLAWGWNVTRRLYPLIVHLPVVLGLVFGMKRPAGISLISLFVGVLCCHFPRHAGIVASVVTGSPLAAEITYVAATILIFPLLLRYFVPSAQDAVNESAKSRFFFGLLPLVDYICEFTFVPLLPLPFSEILPIDYNYSSIQILAEVMPTVMGQFYMIYTAAYCRQLRRRSTAELMSIQMAEQLRQAGAEISSLRRMEDQVAEYHHNMRHHLAAIDGFLAAGSPRQAREYIKRTQTDIEAIVPRRFCENELVNLLCSSFFERAERMRVLLKVEATVPGILAISNTELCALLSNGLENALNAAGAQEEGRRWVDLYCGVQMDKLLIEIRNPYSEPILFQDHLPVTDRPGHGYGCRSIRAIAEAHHGIYEFSAEGGIFAFSVALPV